MHGQTRPRARLNIFVMPRMHPSIKFAHVQKPVEEVEVKSCLNRDQYDQDQKPNWGCFKCDHWRNPICIGIPHQTFPKCHKGHRNKGPKDIVQHLITKEKRPHICGHRTQEIFIFVALQLFRPQHHMQPACNNRDQRNISD